MFCSFRTKKKRRLTDKVKIIDFPGQSTITESKPQNVNSIKASSLSSITLKKEVKRLTAPTQQQVNTILSIEDLKKKSREEILSKDEDTVNKPRTPFSFEDLKVHWRTYAYQIKDSKRNGATTAFSTLIKKDPEMDEDLKVSCEVPNILIYDLLFNDFVGGLQTYLREKLNNWGIVVALKIVEDESLESKALNGKDKFDLMAQKNINLLTLKKIFNLDIEY